MDLRKLHNISKRDFINEVTQDGNTVLDVGCGCGGDLMKWGRNNVVITACDPDERSVCEAKTRSKNLKVQANFFVGDISVTPIQPYDIICYNFSLQYIFASQDLFMKTLDCIKQRSKVGTVLMGVVPDSDSLLHLPSFTRDAFGSEIHKGDLSGDFGDCIKFFIPGTPYYKNGPVAEPVAWKDLLQTYLFKQGFVMVLWTPLLSFYTGTVSDVYSKFIFRRIK